MTDTEPIVPQTAETAQARLDAARHALLAATEAVYRATKRLTSARMMLDEAARAHAVDGSADPDQRAARAQIVTDVEAAMQDWFTTGTALTQAKTHHEAQFYAAGCPPLPAVLGAATLPLVLTPNRAGYAATDGGI